MATYDQTSAYYARQRERTCFQTLIEPETLLGDIQMCKTVAITYYNTEPEGCERIDPSLVIASGEPAYPTGRVLEGSADHGFCEEWKEPASLPDGRPCERVYLFDFDDITDDDGNEIDAEDYPWDDDHVARVILSD